MSSLSYIMGSMSVGKSTHLLQNAYNHSKNGLKVLYYTSSLDNRYGVGKITSRIGINANAEVIPKDDISVLENIVELLKNDDYMAIYIDECQFLNSKQVDFLSDIVDNYDIDIYCYGIKTDFEGKLFEGSKRLLEIADSVEELKNLCENHKCKNLAIMNARIVDSNEQVLIGGSEAYKSLCRKCYKQHCANKRGI